MLTLGEGLTGLFLYNCSYFSLSWKLVRMKSWVRAIAEDVPVGAQCSAGARGLAAPTRAVSPLLLSSEAPCPPSRAWLSSGGRWGRDLSVSELWCAEGHLRKRGIQGARSVSDQGCFAEGTTPRARGHRGAERRLLPTAQKATWRRPRKRRAGLGPIRTLLRGSPRGSVSGLAPCSCLTRLRSVSSQPTEMGALCIWGGMGPKPGTRWRGTVPF